MNVYDPAFQESHDFLLTEKSAEYPGQHTDEKIKIHLNFNGLGKISLPFHCLKRKSHKQAFSINRKWNLRVLQNFPSIYAVLFDQGFKLPGQQRELCIHEIVQTNKPGSTKAAGKYLEEWRRLTRISYNFLTSPLIFIKLSNVTERQDLPIHY